MMNFKEFFKTKSTRPHHQTDGRIMNMDRKHLNLVAKSQSPFQYKNNALDSADQNKSVLITNSKAQQIAKQYGLNIDKEDKTKTFEKQLKDSGKFLVYIPNKGYYIKTK